MGFFNDYSKVILSMKARITSLEYKVGKLETKNEMLNIANEKLLAEIEVLRKASFFQLYEFKKTEPFVASLKFHSVSAIKLVEMLCEKVGVEVKRVPATEGKWILEKKKTQK